MVRRSAVVEDDADADIENRWVCENSESGREESEGRKQRGLLMKATFVSIMVLDGVLDFPTFGQVRPALFH